MDGRGHTRIPTLPTPSPTFPCPTPFYHTAGGMHFFSALQLCHILLVYWEKSTALTFCPHHHTAQAHISLGRRTAPVGGALYLAPYHPAPTPHLPTLPHLHYLPVGPLQFPPAPTLLTSEGRHLYMIQVGNILKHYFLAELERAFFHWMDRIPFIAFVRNMLDARGWLLVVDAISRGCWSVDILVFGLLRCLRAIYSFIGVRLTSLPTSLFATPTHYLPHHQGLPTRLHCGATYPLIYYFTAGAHAATHSYTIFTHAPRRRGTYSGA